MSWTDWFTWPRAAISDIQRDIYSIRGVLLEIPTRLIRLEKLMADVAPILNKLADDLRTWSAGPFAAVLAENASLKAENASLRGEADTLRAEDAGESSAATNAVDAFNELVAPVTESPDVPVEIPPVEVPAPVEDPAPVDPPMADPETDPAV